MNRHHLPFRSIVAFEAAARLGSVTRAAEELRLTQSAVSRQIAALEHHVGIRLFLRAHRQIELTAHGRNLYEELSSALKTIEVALKNVPASPDHRRITIATHATFALKWLIPRLARFKSAHPDIELQLKISPEVVDFSRQLIDCAVQYSPFVGRNLYSRRLCNNVILPVCHPDLLKEFRRAVAKRDLGVIPLIHAQTRSNDWLRWLQHFNIVDRRHASSLIFENSFLAYEAARKGLGVAMAHRSMILDDLRAGLLRELPHLAMPIEETYNFVTEQGRQNIHSIRSLEDWLVAEFAACSS